MKKSAFQSAFLFLLLLGLTACGDENKQVNTRVSGRVLEQGSLEPVEDHAICISVIEGFSGWFSSSQAEEIFFQHVEGSSYDVTFKSSDYRLLRLYAQDTGFRYIYSGSELTPGAHNVRDLIVAKAATLRLTAIDTNRFEEAGTVAIYNESIYRGGGPSARLNCDSTSYGDTNHLDIKLAAGGKYVLIFSVRAENQTYLYQETHELTMPFNDTITKTIFY